jgi:hypothetical protein
MEQQVPQYIRLLMQELSEFGLKYKYTHRGAHLYDQIDISNVRSHSIGYLDRMLTVGTKNRDVDLWCVDPRDLKSVQQLHGDVLRLHLLDHNRQLYVPPHLRPRSASLP